MSEVWDSRTKKMFFVCLGFVGFAPSSWLFCFFCRRRRSFAAPQPQLSALAVCQSIDRRDGAQTSISEIPTLQNSYENSLKMRWEAQFVIKVFFNSNTKIKWNVIYKFQKILPPLLCKLARKTIYLSITSAFAIPVAIQRPLPLLISPFLSELSAQEAAHKFNFS